MQKNGIWICKHKDCKNDEYIICPRCWGQNERLREKIEKKNQKKLRDKRMFAASEEDEESSDDYDDIEEDQGI